MRWIPYIAGFFLLAGACLLLPENIGGREELALALALLGVALALDEIFDRRFCKLQRAGSVGFALVLGPGTILHELSHALMALLVGAKVQQMVLFSPNPRTGTLGYVRWQAPVNRWLVLRGTAIGMAPWLGCGAAVVGLLSVLRPAHLSWPTLGAGGLGGVLGSFEELLLFLGTLLTDGALGWVGTALVAYLALTVAIGAAPSLSDFRLPNASIRQTGLSLLLLALALGGLLLLLPPARQLVLRVFATTTLVLLIAVVLLEVLIRLARLRR